MKVVQEAWTCPWRDADSFRILDYKLRNTAKRYAELERQACWLGTLAIGDRQGASTPF